MRTSDIYLVGYLTGMEMDVNNILKLMQRRDAAGIPTDIRSFVDIRAAQLEFSRLFPAPVINMLCRWTLTLSETFANHVLEWYFPDRHHFRPGIGQSVNNRFRYYIARCRIDQQHRRVILPAESLSAVYLHSNHPNHAKATNEFLFYYWASLAKEPKDLQGLERFLRQLVGQNCRVAQMVEQIYQLIPEKTQYLRGSILATILPNILGYLSWLSSDNPVDRKVYEIDNQ